MFLVVSNIFYFHPFLRKISNLTLTNIFQMGWNHQPDNQTNFFKNDNLGTSRNVLPTGTPHDLNHWLSPITFFLVEKHRAKKFGQMSNGQLLTARFSPTKRLRYHMIWLLIIHAPKMMFVIPVIPNLYKECPPEIQQWQNEANVA